MRKERKLGKEDELERKGAFQTHGKRLLDDFCCGERTREKKGHEPTERPIFSPGTTWVWLATVSTEYVEYVDDRRVTTEEKNEDKNFFFFFFFFFSNLCFWGCRADGI